MMIKFMNHGTGSAGAAADYLTGILDSQGKVREEVEVLRGDPGQVADVAESLEFEHKYTSGVIAWAPEDEPTDEQIGQTLDEFEQFAWAGLEADRYSWTAVLHRDAKGGTHVHVLAARVDLETGKSLNVAPPNWERPYAALRNWLNEEHGWSRPDDPERKRVLQPAHRGVLESGERDPRQRITDYLVRRIQAGEITDRASMVGSLKKAGFEVPRQGRDYLTVADPGTGGRWRLKGAIYGQTFSREGFIDQFGRRGPEAGAGVRTAVSREHRASAHELHRHRRARARYHRAHYGRVGPAAESIGAWPAGCVP